MIRKEGEQIFFFPCFFVVSVLHAEFPRVLTSGMVLVSFDAVSVRKEEIIRQDLFIVHIIYV